MRNNHEFLISEICCNVAVTFLWDNQLIYLIENVSICLNFFILDSTKNNYGKTSFSIFVK